MSLQKASAFMRGGGCCGSPLPIFWREIVRGAWREYLTALSVRQWAIIGAVLPCALGSAYLLWSDAEESVVIVQNVETAPSSTEIAGLSAAAKRTALRNPFSSAHERRGEIPPHRWERQQKKHRLRSCLSPRKSRLQRIFRRLHRLRRRSHSAAW